MSSAPPPSTLPPEGARVRFIQYSADLQPGDAVSDMVRLLASMARGWGFEPIIVAGGAALELRGEVTLLGDWKATLREQPSDLHVYHFGGACPPLADAFLASSGTRWLIYHSATPPHWFAPYDPNSLWATGLARLELERLRKGVSKACSYSSSNLDELRAAGFAQVTRIPVLIESSHFLVPADAALEVSLSDGPTNLLFVGRVAPNKCHEDIIRTFYLYHKGINPHSRLHLVGSLGIEAYVERLRRLISSLGLDDAVSLPGKVSPGGLTAYYRCAHAFICMSEHEGFCVPLVEAMHHRVPILAFAAAAVPETLGGAGLLVRQKSFEVMAEALALLVGDEGVRTAVLKAQDAQRASFQLDAAASRLRAIFAPALGRHP